MSGSTTTTSTVTANNNNSINNQQEQQQHHCGNRNRNRSSAATAATAATLLVSLERQHAVWEAQRHRQRRHVEELVRRQQQLTQELQHVQTERQELDQQLHQLDHDIDQVETEIALLLEDHPEVEEQEEEEWIDDDSNNNNVHRQNTSTTTTTIAQPVAVEAGDETTEFVRTEHPSTATTPTINKEIILTEPTTRPQPPSMHHVSDTRNPTTTRNGWNDYSNEDIDDDIEEVYTNTTTSHTTTGRAWGTLQFTAIAAHPNQPKPPKTIEDFFQRKNPPPSSTAVTTMEVGPHHPTLRQQNQQHRSSNNNCDPNAQFQGEDFPWSQQMMNLLRNTFRIQNFRDHQKEIINATLQGKDVFVIMRTGGGKSLTYQLPALLEGRHLLSNNNNKITFVISPLLSLIQDQVEQMNALCPGSALSFTGSLSASEQARQWALVRNTPNGGGGGGVCLVLVTPEKVSKSNKLCAELDQLHQQGRLGRFVIDEAHCACQWGHDFRPDYAQLGKLKSHFPSIPVMAVTATASDRVRQDVCEILRLDPNHCAFFRSTAHRPNLTYSVLPKPATAMAVVEEMAEFIQQKYPAGRTGNAGIVYTGTKKDADAVADALCEYGIVARAYHADVSATRKEMIHRSWMRNETQVVVATIAFGLGINKPDVRFVLHHSISKTLEAYYQESGRAGRDGNPAECVLYYSPKDVIRMHKMVHGTSSEHLLWPMIRYGQESGNDAVCKAILLTHLGEPNAPDVHRLRKEHEGETTVPRDVGKHAQTVVRLLEERMAESKAMTMAMLVKDWRSTLDTAPQYVRENSPAKDGLSVDACERIIISLMLENVLAPDPVWNAYDTVIYFVLGAKGRAILQAANPSFVIGFPKVEARKSSVKPITKQSKTRKAVVADGGEWLSTKPKAKRKKAATTTTATTGPSKVARKNKTTSKGKKKNTRTKSRRKAPPKSTAARAKTESSVSEVIDLLSDDDDQSSSVDVALASLKRTGSMESSEENLWDDESDEEYEFE